MFPRVSTLALRFRAFSSSFNKFSSSTPRFGLYSTPLDADPNPSARASIPFAPIAAIATASAAPATFPRVAIANDDDGPSSSASSASSRHRAFARVFTAPSRRPRASTRLARAPRGASDTTARVAMLARVARRAVTPRAASSRRRGVAATSSDA